MGGQSIPLEGIWSIAQTLSQNCNFSLMPKWNFLYYLSLHCVCLIRSLTPSYLQGKIFLDSGRLQPHEYLRCSSFCLSSISLMRPQTAHSTSHVAPEAPNRIKQSIATSWWLSSCYYSWGCCCLCGSQVFCWLFYILQSSRHLLPSLQSCSSASCWLALIPGAALSQVLSLYLSALNLMRFKLVQSSSLLRTLQIVALTTIAEKSPP